MTKWLAPKHADSITFPKQFDHNSTKTLPKDMVVSPEESPTLLIGHCRQQASRSIGSSVVLAVHSQEVVAAPVLGMLRALMCHS